jgi:hypothetical protein
VAAALQSLVCKARSRGGPDARRPTVGAAPPAPCARSDDPTIFAWDIANELRCEGDETYRKVTDFIHQVRACARA